MDRLEFFKHCGYSCIGLVGLSLAAEGCAGNHYVQTKSINNSIQISKKEFEYLKKDKLNYHKHIIINIDKNDYPLVLFRLQDNDYSALLLRCTHQGVELIVNGNLLSCSAHGSEFSNKGEVLQGPAEQKLKSYPVLINNDTLTIHIS